jgi:hypothetical protein
MHFISEAWVSLLYGASGSLPKGASLVAGALIRAAIKNRSRRFVLSLHGTLSVSVAA